MDAKCRGIDEANLVKQSRSERLQCSLGVTSCGGTETPPPASHNYDLPPRSRTGRTTDRQQACGHSPHIH